MAPKFLPIAFTLLLGALVPASAASVTVLEKQHIVPVRIDVGGYRLNSVLVKTEQDAELPPIVFIHGASASLYDPMFSFLEKLRGRARLLFVDRPGHGNSDIGGAGNILPDGQADAIAQLMKRRGISRAIIVGHSFGGAIAASLAVRHPDMVTGIVFLSPAVYAWEGGIAWYYTAASAPFSGPLFSTFIAPPAGLLAINQAIRGVFAPNPAPAGYVEATHALAALRPRIFRHNAQEVAALSEWASRASPGYRQIKAPTVIITGDTDNIVSPEVHSRQLARDISGSTLIVVHNLGHKSDYVANDLAIAAIEKIAGRSSDLKAAQETLEQRIQHDRAS